MYVLYHVATVEGIMHGLYLLWWVQERRVPTAAVAAILAAGDLALVALEIPTGWLADRYGHRVSLIAGSLVQILAMIACWLGRGVPGVLAAALLVALGDALRSGADQALLYRTCVAVEREAAFQRIEATARTVQLVSLVLMTLAGGWIVQRRGFAAGWLVETLVCAAGLLIACAMVDPPARVNGRVSGDGESAAPRASTAVPSPSVARSRFSTLLALIVPVAVLGSAGSAMSFLAQTSGGVDPGPLTLFVAVLTLAEAAGSALAGRLAASPTGRGASVGLWTQMMLGALGGAVLASAFATKAALFPAAIALSLLLGVATPLRAAAIQRLAGETTRARTASLASACDKACTTLALLVAGSYGPLTSRFRDTPPSSAMR